MKTAILFASIVLIALVLLWLNRSSQVKDAPKKESFLSVVSGIEDIDAIHAEHRTQDEKMTHEQIMERAFNDLQLKTSAHAGVWKLGEEERWDWDGEKGTLLLTFKDKIVRTRAQFVGSYVYSRKSWLWAWANKTIPEDSKSDAKTVHNHMIQRHVAGFDQEELSVDEQDAWAFTSLACYLADAQGAYSGREGDMRAFFTFHDIEILPRQ